MMSMNPFLTALTGEEIVVIIGGISALITTLGATIVTVLVAIKVNRTGAVTANTLATVSQKADVTAAVQNEKLDQIHKLTNSSATAAQESNQALQDELTAARHELQTLTASSIATTAAAVPTIHGTSPDEPSIAQNTAAIKAMETRAPDAQVVAAPVLVLAPESKTGG